MVAHRACRILIVEDEALVAVLLEDLVTEFGCESVGPLARIDAAERPAREAALDLAILDVDVGGEPVYPIAEILAARGIPLLFVTGYGRAQLAAPFRHYLVLSKPFSIGAFRAALIAALAAPEP